jgi:hypothetical protein
MPSALSPEPPASRLCYPRTPVRRSPAPGLRNQTLLLANLNMAVTLHPLGESGKLVSNLAPAPSTHRASHPRVPSDATCARAPAALPLRLSKPYKAHDTQDANHDSVAWCGCFHVLLFVLSWPPCCHRSSWRATRSQSRCLGPNAVGSRPLPGCDRSSHSIRPPPTPRRTEADASRRWARTDHRSGTGSCDSRSNEAFGARAGP